VSWAVGFDTNWNRWIGYGVKAWCDHPKCNEIIDRGLSYVCGGEPHGGDKGCGLYFCSDHTSGVNQRCPKCARHDHKSYAPKPEHPDWLAHQETHESWAQWRKERDDEKAGQESRIA
jgi:hypothetical protein